MADNLKEKIDEAADKLDRLNGKLKTTLKEVRHWDTLIFLLVRCMSCAASRSVRTILL